MRSLLLFCVLLLPGVRSEAQYKNDNVLYKTNVFITPGVIFGDSGDKYVRVSLCAPVEKFEEAIRRIKN